MLQTFSQSDVAGIGTGHTRQNGYFVGWLPGPGSVAGPLEIRNDFNQPTIFNTNLNERMRIAEYGNVRVGADVAAIPFKFYTILTSANSSLPSGVFTSVAIRADNAFQTQSGINIGIQGWCFGGNQNTNIGGSFFARRANTNVGVDALVGDLIAGATNVGVVGMGMRTVARDHIDVNIGILTRAANGPQSIINSELIGISAGIDGALGGPNEWAGAFQGAVQIWGDAFSNQGLLTSDAQFKTNIEPIENALDVINQLAPKKYNFLTDEFSHLNFPEGEQFGVIAQEILEVLPNLVQESRMLTARDTAGNVTAEPIDYLAVIIMG